MQECRAAQPAARRADRHRHRAAAAAWPDARRRRAARELLERYQLTSASALVRPSWPARVFLHIGLPKTGTTYLQDVAVGQPRPAGARTALLLPGAGHRRAPAGRARGAGAGPCAGRAPGRRRRPWQRPGDEARAGAGDRLVTHEFFCGASRRAGARMVADLAPAEVHVVVTARHAAGCWHRRLAGDGSRTAAPRRSTTSRPVDGDPADELGWGTCDLPACSSAGVSVVPPERVHVLPMPRQGAARRRALGGTSRRCSVGLASGYPLPERPANHVAGRGRGRAAAPGQRAPDGVPQRRPTAAAGSGAISPSSTWSPSDGEQFGAAARPVADCRRAASGRVRMIRAPRVRRRGRRRALLVPDDLPDHRHP